MKKSKLFAPFLMLFAGAIACIVMFRGNYDMTELLTILLCVLLAFYIAGTFIQKKIVSFVEQIQEKEAKEAEEAAALAAAEGEVIEKDVATEEGSTEV